MVTQVASAAKMVYELKNQGYEGQFLMQDSGMRIRAFLLDDGASENRNVARAHEDLACSVVLRIPIGADGRGRPVRRKKGLGKSIGLARPFARVCGTTSGLSCSIHLSKSGAAIYIAPTDSLPHSS